MPIAIGKGIGFILDLGPEVEGFGDESGGFFPQSTH